MRRGLLLGVLAGAGIACGSASAAFWSSTSNTGSAFTTRAVTSQPVIGAVRVTDDPACGPATPESTIRQGGAAYVCVATVTDPAGIASVSADLSSMGAGAAVPLAQTGGPFGAYDWRSSAVTMGVPLDTGTSGVFSVSATNGTGDRTTASGQAFNVRSYPGLLLGEFGAPGVAEAAVYYRLSTTTTRDTNLGTFGTLNAAVFGSPLRNVSGALVGDLNGGIGLSAANLDYLRFGRPGTIGYDYALEAWVRGSATSGSGPGTRWSDAAGIIDAGRVNNNNDFGLAVDATGRIVAGCGNSAVATLRSAPGALADGAWHHLVFTRQQSTGDIRLYLDGGLVDALSTCNTTAHIGSGNLYIGRSHESDLYLTGDVDEVALYTRTLSAAEVLDHYRLGRGLG